MVVTFLRFCAKLLLDVFAIVVLFALGVGLAGMLRLQFSPNQEWTHVFWLVLGFVPMALYLRYRCDMDLDRWDVVAVLPMMIVSGLVVHFFGSGLSTIVVMLMIPLTSKLRELLPSRKPPEIVQKVQT